MLTAIILAGVLFTQDADPFAGKTITEIAPAPPPGPIVLPMPPQHAIAPDSNGLTLDDENYRRARAAIDRGVTALQALQTEGGLWTPQVEAAPSDEPEAASPVSVAITALAVKAIVQRDPAAATSEPVRRALHEIDKLRRSDGLYEGGAMTSYVTSTVTSMLAVLDDAAPSLGLADELEGTVSGVQAMQWDESEGVTRRQDWYGGYGYGSHGRPDLSNTQFMLEALYDAGLSPDEPAFQRAIEFLSRTQNLQAVNHADWAGNDGGFVYTPAGGGESMASQAAGEGRYGESMPEGTPRALRSYGSMTYAGFKSLLYAGLGPEDVRVRAAYDWIRRHWTFDENPGMGQQGLYYYVHAMSRALRIAQQDMITDSNGRPHAWRNEMIDALIAKQQSDGTWVNEAERWLEAEPALATAYAVLALEEAIK